LAGGRWHRFGLLASSIWDPFPGLGSLSSVVIGSRRLGPAGDGGAGTYVRGFQKLKETPCHLTLKRAATERPPWQYFAESWRRSLPKSRANPCGGEVGRP